MDDHHGCDPWTVGRQQRISSFGNAPYSVPVARPLAIALRGAWGVKPQYMSALTAAKRNPCRRGLVEGSNGFFTHTPPNRVAGTTLQVFGSMRLDNCPSGTLPLFNNLPGDHDSTATTNRNRSVTESHARFTTASEREGGVNRGALRLQNGQVVESLRVGSVPVRGVEGS